jgi:hypothetical protein
MNARKIMNGTLAALLFAWSMAAALPALNRDVLSPFEAFVLTPGLLMAAALAARGLYDGLDRLQQRLYRGISRFSPPRAREEGSQVAGIEGCVVGRSH